MNPLRGVGPAKVLLVGGVTLVLLMLAGGASAQAATLTISGECRGCAPATPAAPGLAFTRMLQKIAVTDLPPFTSIQATQIDPGGTVTLQGCRPFGNVGERRAELFARYAGNGAYSVVVDSYTQPADQPGFAPCTGAPTRQDVISYSIEATAAVAALGKPYVVRSSATQRSGWVDVVTATALNDSETVAARDGVIGPDGGLTGTPISVPFVFSPPPGVVFPPGMAPPSNGSSPGISRSLFAVSTPGVYTLVARPIAQIPSAGALSLAPGPWSAPATVKVMTRFDLDPTKLLDGKAPTYGIRMKVNTPEARGTRVRVALGVCAVKTGCRAATNFKRFKSLGSKTVAPDGTITFRALRLPRGKISGLRLTHPGTDLVLPGSALQPVRVYSFSGKAGLRPAFLSPVTP